MLFDREREAYLSARACDACASTANLTVVYRKRWWVELPALTWSQPKWNREQALGRSRVVCRACTEDRIAAIRAVLVSGVRYARCQDGDCARPVAGRGFCVNHRYSYMRLTGVRPRRMAERGAGRINADGYRVLYVPGHPNAGRSGRIAEHRKVMADKLGRALRLAWAEQIVATYKDEFDGGLL